MTDALTFAKAEESLQELGLKRCAELLAPSAEWAANKDATYIDFLMRLLDSEIDERRSRHLQGRLRAARFPYQKTLADFDFAFQPSIDERQIQELAHLSFVAEAHNVVFLGPPGPVPWYSSSLFSQSKGLISRERQMNSVFCTEAAAVTRRIRPFANSSQRFCSKTYSIS